MVSLCVQVRVQKRLHDKVYFACLVSSRHAIKARDKCATVLLDYIE